MKRGVTCFSMLFLAFILLAQLSALSPVTGAAQSNKNKQTYMRKIPSEKQLTNSQKRCLRKCKSALDICLERAGKNQGRQRSCAVNGRNCARRCGVNI